MNRWRSEKGKGTRVGNIPGCQGLGEGKAGLERADCSNILMVELLHKGLWWCIRDPQHVTKHHKVNFHVHKFRKKSTNMLGSQDGTQSRTRKVIESLKE